MEPLTTGDYSKSMRAIVKNRLPKFSKLQSSLVNGSFDFIGINYYSSSYISNAPSHGNAKPSYATDPMTSISCKDTYLFYLLFILILQQIK
jgi:beta-glucosidase